MMGSGRNLLKSRNNAFKYLAIEEWIKEGSQEKRGGSRECKIPVRNAAGDPLFHPYDSSVGYFAPKENFQRYFRQEERPLT